MHEPLRYDHYRVLGISRDASSKQIKQAYRERAKDCHPDRNPSPRAAALFHAVHMAYEELKDPMKRRSYDDRLQHYRYTSTTRPQAGPAPKHRTPMEADRDLPVNRFAFVGLHVTGLCFGVALVSGILVGITFFQWPPFTLVFCLPGLAVIPDSLSGIRMK
jgi:hypothetical protein